VSSFRVGIVTGRETAVNREHGGPAVRLLQVQITDPNDVQTVQLVGQAGEENNPPNGTLVLVLPGGQAFKLSVGTSDWVVPIMAVGGKRIYAVDPATGSVACDAQFKPDGTIALAGPVASATLDPDGTVTIDNGAASITMNPDGTFTFHGVSSTFDHPITAPAMTLTAAGGGTGMLTAVNATLSSKPMLTHKHGGVQTGTGQTGEPV
jgi:hypothetical protein